MCVIFKYICCMYLSVCVCPKTERWLCSAETQETSEATAWQDRDQASTPLLSLTRWANRSVCV